MPNILVVQLKRFSTTNVRNYSYYGTTATTEKITTPVDFPDVLDLTPCAAAVCCSGVALELIRFTRAGT